MFGRLMISLFSLFVFMQCSPYYDKRIGTDGDEMLLRLPGSIGILNNLNGEDVDMRYCIFNGNDYSSDEDFEKLKEAIIIFCEIETKNQYGTLNNTEYLALKKNLINKLVFLGYLRRNTRRSYEKPTEFMIEVAAIEKVLEEKFGLISQFSQVNF